MTKADEVTETKELWELAMAHGIRAEQYGDGSDGDALAALFSGKWWAIIRQPGKLPVELTAYPSERAAIEAGLRMANVVTSSQSQAQAQADYEDAVSDGTIKPDYGTAVDKAAIETAATDMLAALRVAEEFHQMGILFAPVGMFDRVVALRHAAIAKAEAAHVQG